MTHGESTVLPRARPAAPLVTVPAEEGEPERDHFASIIPDGHPSLFKSSKGKVGMR
jgi:hypothetical protein